MASHLSHDEFFSSLTDLLSKTSQKTRGSVFLTQKPLLDSKSTASLTAGSSNLQPSILIRATDGNTNAPNPKSKDGKITKITSSKVKISTVASPDELEAFYARYAEVCKAGMSGLKKRDRKRKAKAKGGAAKGQKA
ncbi:signal recognition particle SRP14 subunit [Penicillium alfredii]|uniref:Signal recognition particle subunit SRP14 n=1 Tax=Penicillium alfredii TaxID=1506179 RepID=A0A9W9GAQ0_9EURO|nr:signal recognition particle SRP14 subunit [Penicillium alfredii]KAJ5115092.1 signal recognition particle SRP14 subunit [Penicillium alfredii]